MPTLKHTFLAPFSHHWFLPITWKMNGTIFSLHLLPFLSTLLCIWWLWLLGLQILVFPLRQSLLKTIPTGYQQRKKRLERITESRKLHIKCQKSSSSTYRAVFINLTSNLCDFALFWDVGWVHDWFSYTYKCCCVFGSNRFFMFIINYWSACTSSSLLPLLSFGCIFIIWVLPLVVFERFSLLGLSLLFSLDISFINELIEKGRERKEYCLLLHYIVYSPCNLPPSIKVVYRICQWNLLAFPEFHKGH